MVDHMPWQAVPVVWIACGLAWAATVRREQIRAARNPSPQALTRGEHRDSGLPAHRARLHQ